MVDIYSLIRARSVQELLNGKIIKIDNSGIIKNVMNEMHNLYPDSVLVVEWNDFTLSKLQDRQRVVLTLSTKEDTNLVMEEEVAEKKIKYDRKIQKRFEKPPKLNKRKVKCYHFKQ